MAGAPAAISDYGGELEDGSHSLRILGQKHWRRLGIDDFMDFLQWSYCLPSDSFYKRKGNLSLVKPLLLLVSITGISAKKIFKWVQTLYPVPASLVNIYQIVLTMIVVIIGLC